MVGCRVLVVNLGGGKREAAVAAEWAVWWGTAPSLSLVCVVLTSAPYRPRIPFPLRLYCLTDKDAGTCHYASRREHAIERLLSSSTGRIENVG